MRFKEKGHLLIEKLISFKFVIFVIATLMRIFGKIEAQEWMLVSGFVLAGHVGMKSLHEIMGGRL